MVKKLINTFNPLQPGDGVAYLDPLKISETENIRKRKGFLMFWGGIDKQHRAVIG